MRSFVIVLLVRLFMVSCESCIQSSQICRNCVVLYVMMCGEEMEVVIRIVY